jgi:hypothetical protein
MRPPPLSLPPPNASLPPAPSSSLAHRAPLLQHDALAHAAADAGSCDSSRDEDWEDTDEGTAESALFFEELRFLSSDFLSCVMPLLFTAAAAAGETISAAWLGQEALLAYAGATMIQAPVTSIVGALVDACGMLSTAPRP